VIVRSLRLRLLAGGAVTIALALAIAWIALTVLFARHIERRVHDELIAQSVPLLAGLGIDIGGRPTMEQEPADPRFALPTSGLYWQASTTRGDLRSTSLWDSRLVPAPDASADRWRDRQAAGPFGQRVLIVERIVRPQPRGPAVTVILASDLGRLAPVQREFARETALFLALLWLILSAAAWVQVTLGLKPIANVQHGVDRLRRDPGARLARAYPTELLPLTDAIDALADAREEDVQRARRRAADLAHGLKTPLAALAVQSNRAREAGATAAADGLDAAIAAVRAAVDGELARTRIGLVRQEGHRTPALPLLEALIGVLERTEDGERIVFGIDGGQDVALPMAGEDAAELFGPLLENAARHARRQVSVSISGMEGVAITIADDGPGLDIARYEQAVLRGERLDSSGDGHGLGLAIAREIAGATGATLSLAVSPLGGLAVRVAWLAD
jgi:signal transduction histidine kinase